MKLLFIGSEQPTAVKLLHYHFDYFSLHLKANRALAQRIIENHKLEDLWRSNLLPIPRTSFKAESAAKGLITTSVNTTRDGNIRASFFWATHSSVQLHLLCRIVARTPNSLAAAYSHCLFSFHMALQEEPTSSFYSNNSPGMQ